ncbi:DsbA family protein [Marinigracilibium pacificum]|uniref:DsbA family protein n=1 Tax=Marinigracilibium pacificum TaxID=2729599 RepID=A0A848IUQ8_9BACT|nr:DsbA family protein [Marinigracilibium pacificum]NMM47025.1 DsbA family protein [Marinigracilibium pacificum]
MAKNELIYVFDPLCGWCYGFSNHIKRFMEDNNSTFEISVYSGGMILGEQVGPIGAIAPFISKSSKTVEERTGVKFGDAFINGVLREGTMVLNSEVPARALRTMKAIDRSKSLEYAHKIQSMLYYDGIDPNIPENYKDIVESSGLDFEDFYNRFSSREYLEKTYDEFKFAAALGVKGYPTLFMRVDETIYLMARGFIPSEEIQRMADKILTAINDN